MIVLKDFPCDSKTEACIEEDKMMREMKTSMNKKRAYITPEERLELNKGYRENNKEKMKEYQQANKEHISESKKKYRQANIERISEQKKEQIECECGCTIKRGDLAKHRKTKKHLNLTI